MIYLAAAFAWFLADVIALVLFRLFAAFNQRHR